VENPACDVHMYMHIYKGQKHVHLRMAAAVAEYRGKRQEKGGKARKDESRANKQSEQTTAASAPVTPTPFSTFPQCCNSQKVKRKARNTENSSKNIKGKQFGCRWPMVTLEENKSI